MAKAIRKYMLDIGLDEVNRLKDLSKYGLSKKIRELDEREWRRDMEQQTTMETYRQNKTSLMKENIYDNTWESVLLVRARTQGATPSILDGEKGIGGVVGSARCVKEGRRKLLYTSLESVLLIWK